MGTMETCDNLQTISLNISVSLNLMYHNDSFLKINSHRICYFLPKNQQFPVGSQMNRNRKCIVRFVYLVYFHSTSLHHNTI
jgi:hypothetical protein